MKYLLTILLLITPIFSADIFDKLEQLEKNEDYFEEGKQYYKERNYTKAYEYFEKAAKLGNQKALYNIGVIYSNKNYHRQDFKKAYDIFHTLALKGHAPSQNRVGMHLSLGLGIDKDYKQAVKWYEKASKQHYITAQCNLAMMYAAGKGVFPNFGRAHLFAKPGFEQGHPICEKVWDDYNLQKYPEDKGFKFQFYTKP